MLSKDENARLTRVGPGTPMGELLRRYWQPVAASAQLLDNPVRKVRTLGEDLVLYRDRQGRLGLIADKCAHRRMGLEWGIPEPEGLRCAYHGWLYDQTGQCLETPLEPKDSTFKDRVQITAYPVQELGGLIWAYLGPEPAPLVPHWDLLVMENGFRQIGSAVLPCNWLQDIENGADPMHNEYLHGYFFKYVLERQGALAEGGRDTSASRAFSSMRHSLKIAFEPYQHGLIKRRLLEGQPETVDEWAIGHPLVFPQMTRISAGIRNEFQFRMPIDDTHTWQVFYQCYAPGPRLTVPHQDVIPFFEVPMTDDRGRPIADTVGNQDLIAWAGQGEITDRSLERLAESDTGIIVFRQMLKEQMAIVEDGGDPINVFRDPAQNQYINLRLSADHDLAQGRTMFHKGYYREETDRYSPVIEQVLDLYRQLEAMQAESAPR